MEQDDFELHSNASQPEMIPLKLYILSVFQMILSIILQKVSEISTFTTFGFQSMFIGACFCYY